MFLTQFWRDEQGVTAIEYGLIAALIAILIVGSLAASGTSLSQLWTRIQQCLAAAAGTPPQAC